MIMNMIKHQFLIKLFINLFLSQFLISVILTANDYNLNSTFNHINDYFSLQINENNYNNESESDVYAVETTLNQIKSDPNKSEQDNNRLRFMTFDNENFPNGMLFVSSRVLSDGEIETKVRWNNSFAIQTKVDDLCLRQISDGLNVIQLWLSNEELLDCEFVTDELIVKELYRQFMADQMSRDMMMIPSHDLILSGTNNASYSTNCNQNETCAGSFSNILIINANAKSHIKEIPHEKEQHELLKLINYDYWHDECHSLHMRVKEQYLYSHPNDIQEGNGNENVKGRGISRGKKKKLKSKKNNSISRWKRADLLVFPGTNWCGKGSTSRNFEDLGTHVFADRCCRDHDGCKHTIGPFEKKYHLFNYRFHYVSHCECDERFRTCLKMSNTPASNLVGKLFFNVIKTKCFVFKSEKVCIRRSWWGKCLKLKKKKRAHFRVGMKY